MKIIPAIDILGGRTVRLEQGEYGRELKYDIDPAEAAKKWEEAGAELLHVVDLDGASRGNPVNLDTVRGIMDSVDIPVETGGGYRTEADIKRAIDLGVHRVVIGSRAIEDIDFARRCQNEFGERIIFSFDAKGSTPGVHGWKKTADVDLFDMLERFTDFGTKEIIYTDILRDGTLSGPNVESIKKILSKIKIKLISAGGIKNLGHIMQLKEIAHMGVSGVIVGRALYDCTLDLGEAIDACKKGDTLS